MTRPFEEYTADYLQKYTALRTQFYTEFDNIVPQRYLQAKNAIDLDPQIDGNTCRSPFKEETDNWKVNLVKNFFLFLTGRQSNFLQKGIPDAGRALKDICNKYGAITMEGTTQRQKFRDFADDAENIAKAFAQGWGLPGYQQPLPPTPAEARAAAAAEEARRREEEERRRKEQQDQIAQMQRDVQQLQQRGLAPLELREQQATYSVPPNYQQNDHSKWNLLRKTIFDSNLSLAEKDVAFRDLERYRNWYYETGRNRQDLTAALGAAWDGNLDGTRAGLKQFVNYLPQVDEELATQGAPVPMVALLQQSQAAKEDIGVDSLLLQGQAPPAAPQQPAAPPAAMTYVPNVQGPLSSTATPAPPAAMTYVPNVQGPLSCTATPAPQQPPAMTFQGPVLNPTPQDPTLIVPPTPQPTPQPSSARLEPHHGSRKIHKNMQKMYAAVDASTVPFKSMLKKGLDQYYQQMHTFDGSKSLSPFFFIEGIFATNPGTAEALELQRTLTKYHTLLQLEMQ